MSFSDIVVLMDMPGLYLQPQSQSRLLEYIRSVLKEENENTQFIIVTNSSALIEKASPEELFMLMPSQQLAEGSNQLVKVSNGDPIVAIALTNLGIPLTGSMTMGFAVGFVKG